MMRKQQVKREIQQIHETWIQAIKETPGIGHTLFKRIMAQREQIAKEVTYGRNVR